MRYVILGTAGHIDHGKSTLVKALTGTDPDRLKEEKERGITIDLGFASLDYPEAGLTVGIVDVPGHEKLIRNMLAGAGGIDLVLLVIAADEGIMPQSREHLQICQLLRIGKGLVAVTKSDLVDPDWLELVIEEVKGFVKGTFLEGADIVPVSARSGQNIELLKQKIKEAALAGVPETAQKPSGGLFRLPIDRVFTLKGFGTVITGTAVSGRVGLEDAVEIMPRGISTKIRGLQSHGKPVREILAGQRAALNLQGVEKDDLQRGDVVVSPGRFTPTYAMDVVIELLKGAPPLKAGSSVHFHLGTSEAVARVVLYGPAELKGGETCFGQIRLKESIVSQAMDRFVIRRLSPLETTGGGSVLDPAPARRKRKDPLTDLEVYADGPLKEKLAQKILKSALRGMERPVIEGWIKAQVSETDRALRELEKEGRVVSPDGSKTFLHALSFKAFKEKALEILGAYHKKNPLKPGMPKEELRAALHADPKLFAGLLPMVPEISMEKEFARLRSFRAATSGKDDELKGRIISELDGAGFQPPDKTELARKFSLDETRVSDILKFMEKEGSLVRISDALWLTRAGYESMLGRLKDFYSRKPDMAVSEFRDVLGTTRKYALPFLEYLDSHKITLRVGDTRKLLIK